MAGLSVYLLPSIHLLACLATAGVMSRIYLESGWTYLAIIDYPVSFVVVGLAWHYDLPLLLVFSVIGTVWWYLLSCAGRFAFAGIRRVRKKAH